jgi:hypothetical protein
MDAIKVRCINPRCKHRSFTITHEELGANAEFARSNESGAVRILWPCPNCATENTIWVKGDVNNTVVIRGEGSK